MKTYPDCVLSWFISEDYSIILRYNSNGSGVNIMPKTVYVAVSTDILHGGHIALIKNASTLGDVMIGLFTDEAVASYKEFPLLDY